jgi:cardiolipin synthase A/B
VRTPKPRNLVFGLLLALAVVGAGLIIAQDQETLRVRTSLAATDPRFPDYLARLLGHPLTTGDRYIVHTDGPAAFPAMLAAIDRASSRISFETYIFDVGTVAEQFTSAFERAARRGVEVRMVLDAIGAKTIDPAHLQRLENAGCTIGWFNSVGSYSLEEINYRTHRKALVIDGDIAFVGGMGIADHWAQDAEDARRWRDTQIEIGGAAAMNIEAAFNENWIETGGIVDPDVLTHTAPAEASASSIVVWSSPEGGTNGMKLLYLLAIAASRETLDIQSPYLITDETTEWSIAEARKRGVRVRMLTEGDATDAKPVKFASRAIYERLMERGVAVYEYQPAMMHTKAIVIDGVLSIVGSANFDNRSLELNDELNVAIFDRATSARLTQDFERDLMRSRELKLEEWRNRPFHIRGREKMWSFFGEIF